MIIRVARADDFTRVSDIEVQYGDYVFPIQHLVRMFVAEAADGRIIGVGYLYTLLEGVLIVDKGSTDIEKAKAFLLLGNKASEETFNLGFNLFHSFIKESSVVTLFKEHFQFEDASGTALIKRVTNG